MATRSETLFQLFEPAINALGYELWGVEYIPQGKHSVLRVYLDKDDGINIDDCEAASRQVSSILDVEDPIAGEYTLEVSSPGIERVLFRLSQYEQYLGSMVKIRLLQSFEKRRNYTGQIRSVNEQDNELGIIVGDEELTIPFELIEKSQLVYQQ